MIQNIENMFKYILTWLRKFLTKLKPCASLFHYHFVAISDGVGYLYFLSFCNDLAFEEFRNAEDEGGKNNLLDVRCNDSTPWSFVCIMSMIVDGMPIGKIQRSYQ